MSELCKHHQEHGVGVEMPLAASLEHFDECFTPERRLEAYRYMRERSEVGTRCLMAGHAEEKALAESAIEIGRRLGVAEGRKQALAEVTEKLITVANYTPYGVEMLLGPQEATSEPLTAPTPSTRTPETERPSSIRIPRGEG